MNTDFYLLLNTGLAAVSTVSVLFGFAQHNLAKINKQNFDGLMKVIHQMQEDKEQAEQNLRNYALQVQEFLKKPSVNPVMLTEEQIRQIGEIARAGIVGVDVSLPKLKN